MIVIIHLILHFLAGGLSVGSYNMKSTSKSRESDLEWKRGSFPGSVLLSMLSRNHLSSSSSHTYSFMVKVLTRSTDVFEILNDFCCLNKWRSEVFGGYSVAGYPFLDTELSLVPCYGLGTWATSTAPN